MDTKTRLRQIEVQYKAAIDAAVRLLTDEELRGCIAGDATAIARANDLTREELRKTRNRGRLQ
ncbi:MAG: hypothetical protein LC116_03885 [Bacteroidetes bacterium]|nr:hypothetical protein [Bacteroidota bacterium]